MGSRDADQTLKIAKLCLKGLKGPFLLHNVVATVSRMKLLKVINKR